MKLFLIHCGYYDSNICDGLYENHVNFFIVASNFEEARAKAKLLPEFQNKKMHVDGMQEIHSVDGFKISAALDSSLEGQTQIINFKHRDLAPKINP